MKPMYTKKEFEDIGEKVIDWCIDEFGLSKHYEHYPYIEIDIDEEDYSLMGEFIGDNNEIIIYLNAINNIDDFINTIIHEYIHYTQSPSWYTRYLNNLTLNEAIKNKHPYEIEADEVAINNWKQCKKEVLNETNN